MTVQSDTAIAGFAVSAGLTDLAAGGAVAIAVAIAIAESGSDDHAWNNVPPDDSYGLWQINMYGSLGPARRAQYGLTSNFQLWAPATNARAMYSISSAGTNWNPWSTFGSGAYLAFMARANVAVGAPAAPAPPDAPTQNSTDGLRFSYAQRWAQVSDGLLSGNPTRVRQAIEVLEQRDRDLEDFISSATRIG